MQCNTMVAEIIELQYDVKWLIKGNHNQENIMFKQVNTSCFSPLNVHNNIEVIHTLNH